MEINGRIAAGFKPVREAFADVVAAQPGTGAATAMWHEGRWVVDLWGGWADAARTRPWRRDSIVMPYSVGKPFAAMSALVLVQQGALELDAPMQRYWPELRAPATVRHALSHAAGLVALDGESLPAETFGDWEALCALLARQEPSWVPGEGLGESALFYGHLLGELVRRVDGRMPRAHWQQEVCGPLGLDFHIGLDAAQQARTVELTGLTPAYREEQLAGRPELYRRGISNPAGAQEPEVVNSPAWRSAQVPAINGHGTARAVAGLYAALLQGQLLDPGLLAEAVSPQASGLDVVLGDERDWGLGFVVEGDGWGMGGLGGNSGWACTEADYAFAFVTGSVGGFERSDRIENAAREVLGLRPL
jgi:CubicO group peptidase (beta-lactamase class C family)